MSIYDEYLGGKTDSFVPEEAFDKDKWAAEKKEIREQVYGMIDTATEALCTDGASYQKYLDVQAHFNRLGASNALLIQHQMPTATRLHEFDSWKEQGAFIKAGQTGIWMLVAGNEYTRNDGNIAQGVTPKKFFDVSQTTARRQQYTYPAEREKMLGLIKSSPVPLEKVDEMPNGTAAAYIAADRKIKVKKGLEPATLFRELSAAVAHATLARGDKNYENTQHSLEAYSVAYMLCKKYGIDTKGFEFEVIPDILDTKFGSNQAGLETAEEARVQKHKEVRQFLTETKTCMDEIHSKMQGRIKEDRQKQNPQRDENR